jgi:hypothetical protein
MTEIKFEITKTRVTAKTRELSANWTMEPWKPPTKFVKSGVDKLNRHYAVLKHFSDAEKSNVMEWLDQTFPESWVGLGDTIWFDTKADLAFFLLRWS